VTISPESRARLSGGGSEPAIYRMVARVLKTRDVRGGRLVDVGCGSGALWQHAGSRFDHYTGVDVARYEGFPAEGSFVELDLDTGATPLPDGTGDVVAAVETIEHLENPRALFRELTRLAKPGGWVVVTTPNQLSLLSLATLVAKQRFSAFQDVHYPAHRTALLEVDLRRLAAECGLEDIAIAYSEDGRIVFTSRHYPGLLSRAFPRACSDNVLIIGRKPRR
jgi:2-polyprenyl-3-methyl-5-hydroxy-6-metoxy-1,4-benzoquinol methylase